MRVHPSHVFICSACSGFSPQLERIGTRFWSAAGGRVLAAFAAPWLRTVNPKLLFDEPAQGGAGGVAHRACGGAAGAGPCCPPPRRQIYPRPAWRRGDFRARLLCIAGALASADRSPPGCGLSDCGVRLLGMWPLGQAARAAWSECFCPGSQQPVRPPIAPDVRPLLQGCPPGREESPRRLDAKDRLRVPAASSPISQPLTI